MKLLLIGHSVVDKINFNNSTIIKPGGIYYSSLAISSIADDLKSVSLLTEIDKESEEIFNIYSGFDQSCIKNSNKITRVELDVFENGDRTEKLSMIAEPLEITNDIFDQNFEGIYLNMITSTQMRLDQLKELRTKTNCPIYMDIHAFSKSIDENLQHQMRSIPDRDEWLKNVDILQVNEDEIFSISNAETEIERAAEILNLGIECLIITKGGLGTSCFINSEKGIISFYIPAEKVESKNFVGCGDVFGASFFYAYIASHDFYKSLRFANRAAGMATIFESEIDFKKLKEIFKEYD